MFKISDLARQTGVPTGTIKYYIREGLLPPPTLKTGRNMAYYDSSFVDRIRAIKELQRKRFLPLEIIKMMLQRDVDSGGAEDVDTLLRLENRLYEEMRHAPGNEHVRRTEISTRYGIAADLVRYCVDAGVLTPVRHEGAECFNGEDLAILHSLGELKRAGFRDDLIPGQLCIQVYVDALARLAKEELELFSRAVTAEVDPARVSDMALAGLAHVEELICLLRRKLLLRALRQLRIDSEVGQTGTDD